jgi:predicted site-specific integrase-resolvase
MSKTLQNLKEDLFELAEGPEKVGFSYQTLRRWAKNGHETESGTVYLEILEKPRFRTSKEAVERFLRSINGIGKLSQSDTIF